MNNTKWFSCIPKPLSGNESFFNRDAGLFCRAFLEIGVESKTVMPLPHRDGELSYVLRTDYKNLGSPDWWRSLNIDGVVLYSWTSSKYNAIAKAIHDAGIKLVIYLDTSSAVYPWQNWKFGTKLMFRSEKFKHGNRYLPYALWAVLRAHTISMANYGMRRKHIGYADIVAIPTPYGVEAYKTVPLLMSKESKKRIRLIPCPIAWHFKYDENVKKEKMVIAVGRWDDEEPKRPRYMMRAIELVCAQNNSLRFDIFGYTPEFMKDWHQNLPPNAKARITLHGVVPNRELSNYYQKAEICLCSSIHEGTHLASAEAVCCGCSVIVAPNPSLAAVHWYASENSGTVSVKDTPESFADAVLKEATEWQYGNRNPRQISDIWCDRLHATQSVKKIIDNIK